MSITETYAQLLVDVMVTYVIKNIFDIKWMIHNTMYHDQFYIVCWWQYDTLNLPLLPRVIDLAHNKLQFRDVDLPKVSIERGERLFNLMLPKNAAHLMDWPNNHLADGYL